MVMGDLSSRSRRRFRRRHAQSELKEEDYLSNLPDELLSHILSFLPTLDSIRTSVLSRRWRHVWTSVPVINFSYFDLQPIIKKHFFVSRGGDSVSRLHLTGRSIDPKNLVFNTDDKSCVVCVSCERLVYDLVKYAKSHGARQVTLLNFFYTQWRSSFFKLVFDWPSLVSLNLQVVGCVGFISKFSERIAFRLSNLKTLSLTLGENIIPTESLSRLLSGCPVLEELRLKAKYFRPELVQIAAPNLLRLTLVTAPEKLQIDCQKLEYLKLKPYFSSTNLQIEAPSLTCVRLFRIWRLGTFAQTLCDVTTLTITVSDECLSSLAPRFLGKYKAIVQGFPVFHKLLQLKIKMYVAEQFSLDIVFDLLRCAPNLQSLVLTESKKRPSDEYSDEWERSSSSRTNEPLEHLERVSMNIKSKRIRSAFLKTLSVTVSTWDRVAVTY
ncbi:putative F-box/LRR-repeat protein At5g02930 [Zingiber officinale]|uniref:putative F-box/LRR-repeat protein At5g02930 n=1 Tax=Zingiber officinale TaxID=94328 RepID=UPI001C4BF4B9|nr:putative F-box/LRR-repeat protein At5g02930 [Zingiber officinale]